MRALSLLCVFILLVGAACADSIVDIGFTLTPSQPAVEWKEGVVINMTCKAQCSVPCTACSSFKYFIAKRNMEYVPNVAYDDFKMYPMTNVTDKFQSKCWYEQTVSILKVQKNESGTVRCISQSDPTRVGIAFLYTFYNVSYTNATLPTEVATTSVEIESTTIKLPVRVRSFNATLDGDNFPYVSCAVFGSSGTTVQWSWANGTKLTMDQAIETNSATIPGGSDSQVTSKLIFRGFADKAASMVGLYRCLIEGNVTMRYPAAFSAPVVKMSEKDYRSSMEGDTMTQSCSIIAYPEAVITWTKNNETLVADGERVKFSPDNATLTIATLKQEDAGLYICTAENSLGLGQAYIKLRVKDRLAALWPFLGILAEVVILVTIILLYERKRAAQKRSQEEQEATEVNKDDHVNANDSDVRHRPVKT